MITNISIIVVLLVVAAISKSISDILAHNKPCILFRYWHNKWFDYAEKTYTNKYSVYPKPKFWLSTTILVWTTDAWHFFNSVRNICFYAIGSMFFSQIYELNWYWYIIIPTIMVFISGIIFELFYSRILPRN